MLLKTYQVFARKWRPKNFADVVGQEHVIMALSNSILSDRLHHAYILSGIQGVGKTTIARLLAKGLNCELGMTDNPCGQCNNCHDIDQSCFIDLIEIDAASRTKVEDMRDLLDRVQYMPVKGRFKIYLIDEVHMLSRHSFNALLKTLEEPPMHVKFLLATTDPQKIPLTILSRCIQYHLKAFHPDQIYHQLKKIFQEEGISSEVQAIYLLAKKAKGSLRDACSLSEQAIALGNGIVTENVVRKMLGIVDSKITITLMEALINADSHTLLLELEKYPNLGLGIEWESILVEMLSFFHHISLLQVLSDHQLIMPIKYVDAELQQRLHELAKRMSPEDLQLYYHILLIGRKELPYAPDPKLGVEMSLLRALAFHPKKNYYKPTI